MRTPNGAADLLVNDPYVPMSFPSHLGSFLEEDEEDELPPRSPHNANNSEIYKRLDSFERKMESELQDLEALGVGTGSDMKRKGLDPDGEGQRCYLPSSISTATTAPRSSCSSLSSSTPSTSSSSKNNIVIRAVKNSMPASLLEKGKCKLGRSKKQTKRSKKHDKISRKTAKIMDDYQAYLAEMQVGYPTSYDSETSSDDELAAVASLVEELENPALVTIAQVREDLKGSYLEKEGRRNQQPDAEEGGYSGTTSGAEPSREDGRYAVGGGHPLYRVWSNDSPLDTAGSSPSSSTHGGYEYATVFGESLIASGQTGDSCGRRRYRNSQSSLPRWLCSRRVQRGLGMVVMACIVIGIYTGVSNIEKRESLPDWEEEYEEEIKREEMHEEEVTKVEMEGEIKSIQDKLVQIEKEEEEREKKMMKEHSMAAAASAATEKATEDATTGEPDPSASVSDSASVSTSAFDPVSASSTDVDAAADGSEIGETAGPSDPVTVKEDNEKDFGEEYEEEIETEEKHEEEVAKIELKGEIMTQPLWQQTEGGDGFQDNWVQLENEKEDEENKMTEEHSMTAAASVAVDMAADMTTEETATGEPTASASSTDVDYAAARSKSGKKSDTFDPFTAKEDNEKGFGEEVAMDLYYNAVKKHNPKMYNRSKGWSGTTYIEALVFCDAQGGLSVCPYDAVCPKGVGGEPLGGYRDAPHGDWAWMPIVDDFDEWAQVGARERCVKYSRKNGKKPTWGTQKYGVDIDPESLTQNIMCCENVM
eukprot:CAMPEP_0181101170 /NCGR_PEP_ID=MMETSP1071-20121207/13606_1 /TAXON_ID=35127 /ORGANISM="Thalassiosira sp., Strain NH16" /LENGTH=761 /DNA_ID=CAMNT_0023183993 /DNA_START=515 /DNA_END=2800 /DNA_ORIENTATION=-